MLARQSLPLWVVVSVFALSAAAVPLAGRWLRPPVTPPGTVQASIELLSQCKPPFQVVRVMERSPEAGVYLCEQPWSIQQLQFLRRAGEYAHCWRGVVLVQRLGCHSEIPPEELRDWGEHGMTIGPLVFFGDPALLRRIHQNLLAQAAGEP